MGTLLRRLVIAVVATLVVTTATAAPSLAQNAAPGARPPAGRAFAASVGPVTGLSPFFSTGAVARLQARVTRYLTVEGTVTGISRVIAAGEADERSMTHLAWQGGARYWPQGRALEGWGIGLAYGQARHQGVDFPVLARDDSPVVLSRLTLDAGHQWLIPAARRFTAFATGGVSRNGRLAAPTPLSVPRTEVTLTIGAGIAF